MAKMVVVDDQIVGGILVADIDDVAALELRDDYDDDGDVCWMYVV